MKRKILSFLVIMLFAFSGCYTQTMFSVSATNGDISENLNLEAVATIFGDSQNLEEFENRLNDPRNQISNLDLNGDGYVDYIRVVENYENGVYLITLQDVLGNDQYQDLATIDVSRNMQGYARVEIIGNPYFYGPNYIIEPIFRTSPVIFSIFWNPHHRFWVSPYYWNYYPRIFRPWRPYALYRYRQHIRSYVRAPQYYRYLKARSYNGHMYRNKAVRNDYERMHPNHDFIHRNKGYRNAQEFHQKRGGYNHNIYRPSKPNENRQTPNRNVKPNRVQKKSPAYRNTKPGQVKEGRQEYNKSRVIKPSGNRNVKTIKGKTNDKKEKPRINKGSKIKQDKKKNNDKKGKRDKKGIMIE